MAEKVDKFSRTFFFAWNTKWRGVMSPPWTGVCFLFQFPIFHVLVLGGQGVILTGVGMLRMTVSTFVKHLAPQNIKSIYEVYS